MAKKKIVNIAIVPETCYHCDGPLGSKLPGEHWCSEDCKTNYKAFYAPKETEMTKTETETVSPVIENTNSEKSENTTMTNPTPVTPAVDTTTIIPMWEKDGETWTINREGLGEDLIELLTKGVIVMTKFEKDELVEKRDVSAGVFLSHLESALQNGADKWCNGVVRFCVEKEVLLTVEKKQKFGKKSPDYVVGPPKSVVFPIWKGLKQAIERDNKEAKQAAKKEKKMGKKSDETKSENNNNNNKSFLTKVKDVVISILKKIESMAKWFIGHVGWAFGKSVLQVEAIIGALAGMYGGLWFFFFNGGTVYYLIVGGNPLLTAIAFLAIYGFMAVLANFVITLVCRLAYVTIVAIGTSVSEWMMSDTFNGVTVAM